MRKRVVSSVILLAIFIPLIILGNIPFALGIGLVSIFIFKEIISLNKYPISVKLLSFISLIAIVYNSFDAKLLINGLNYHIIGISLLLILLPVLYYQSKNKYNTDDAFKLYGEIFLLGIGLNSLILVRSMDLKYFLYILLITIFTDVFAYIGGNLIGKNKLSKLSPKKTIEGLLVGLVMATFLMTIYYVAVIGGNYKLIIVIIYTFIISLIGQAGDLFFSAIKRQNNIKDFSNLIPGHGGLLDRFDSLLFVSIAFIILASL